MQRFWRPLIFAFSKEMNDSNITKIIEIDCSRSAVFEALTDLEAIKSYFPITEVEAEWKVGGSIKFVGEESGTDEGVIDALEQNSKFQFSYWNQNHGRERKSENLVTISYSLKEIHSGRRTQLTMTQSNLPFSEYKAMMDPIWDQLLDNLKSHIENR